MDQERVCMCVCVCVWVYVCEFVHDCVWMCACVNMCECVRVYVCAWVTWETNSFNIIHLESSTPLFYYNALHYYILYHISYITINSHSGISIFMTGLFYL
jgi:hypothetical protein